MNIRALKFAKVYPLLIAAATTVAPPAHAKDADPTITIRFRHPYGICTGVCPNFEMRVAHDGNVTTRSLWPDDSETTHFRAKDANYVRFLYLVERLKYLDQQQLDTTCKHARLQDGSPDPLDDPRPDDIEMKWADSRGTVRVTGCASNTLLRVALQGALNVLGADWVSGKKLDK
jgi:hypothetical protein